MDYTIHRMTHDDIDSIAGVLAKVFLVDDDLDSVTASEKTVFEPERTYGVFADDRLVGCGEILTRTICVPGRGQTPVAAITSVGVLTDHRRRGVLTRIMKAQLHGLHEAGAEPISALWASEASIYGRYGYGLATEYIRHEITAKAPFRPGVDLGTEPVREVQRDEAMPIIRPLYDRYAATRVGVLGRGDGHWAYRYLESPRRRNGASSLRYALHPDGYAAYRVNVGWTDRGPDGQVLVYELVANTAPAYAALLRHLLDVDLIGRIEYDGATDEPLTLLLQTPRAALRKRFDGLFVRLVDIDRGLMARGYASAVDVVIEIVDELCPWNEGRWRFKVDEDGSAIVERTTAEPDLSTTTTDLGAAFLGGTRISALAAVGRVIEHKPGAVARLSAAFLADREPACLEVF